jgi:FAD-dependent oxidoreductase domain-containing protein 1
MLFQCGADLLEKRRTFDKKDLGFILVDYHYDILVIGAGVLGIASAFHLLSNNRSKKILVIDNLGGVGQAGTGRSAAMFRNTFTSIDNQILANTSIDYYLSVQEKSGIDLGLQLIGYLWLMSKRQFQQNTKNIERMKSNGIELKTLTKEELGDSIHGLTTTFEASSAEAAALGLENIDGGVFGTKCGKLEPDRLTRFYCDQFIAMGGKCQFNSRATKLLVEPRRKLNIEDEPFVWQETRIAGVQVKGLLEGDIYAETIILAGGAWNNILLEPIGLDGHTKSKKRQIFQISTKGRSELQKMLFSRDFNPYGIMPFTILPRCSIYLKPVQTGEQFWIGCDDEMNREFVNLPDFDSTKYVAEPSYYQKEIYPVLASYFPNFENLVPSSMWAGLISYNTIDYLPYVFAYENLIVVGGDSGSGIMKGDALGRIVDSVYRDGPDAEVSLYGNIPYHVAKLGVKKRSVEPEEWLL